jgi:hypothetical protein
MDTPAIQPGQGERGLAPAGSDPVRPGVIIRDENRDVLSPWMDRDAGTYPAGMADSLGFFWPDS